MNELIRLLTGGGRKFAVGISALRYSFVLACLSLAVIAVRPTSGVFAAEVMGAFGLVVSVIVGSYQVSNALGDKWNPSTKTSTTTSTVTDTPSPPRQSGMVKEPPEET